MEWPLSTTRATRLRQASRYIVVGLGTNALALVGYCSLTALGVAPRLALPLLNVLVFAISFEMNRRYTFGASMYYSSFLLFLLGYLGSMALQNLILAVGVLRFGFPHQLVVFVGLGFASLLFYFYQKIFIFKKVQSKFRS